MHRTAMIRVGVLAAVAILVATAIAAARLYSRPASGPASAASASGSASPATATSRGPGYRPRIARLDSSGFSDMIEMLEPWGPNAPLGEVAESYRRFRVNIISQFDNYIESFRKSGKLTNAATSYVGKATMYNEQGKPRQAAEALAAARAIAEADERIAREFLFTVVYLQGVTAMRIGENDNCIDCRGEGSCILPISEAAVHIKPEGSRAAIGHFAEYLAQFPDDFEVRWLLNVAHMTLGEHPSKVDPKYLISLDRFRDSEFDIGKFRDVGHLVGVNRLNQAGGAIMDDFDNDGLLDLVTSSWDPAMPMAYYRNRGDGSFDERGEKAGLAPQLGGLYCVQADYDNDGHLDLFVCCERQPSRLYRNKGDGTFEDVATSAGLGEDPAGFCKGAAWIDYDNDGDPDLFLNHLRSAGTLYRNNGDGTFADVSSELGIDGPTEGFSCWAWDFDNDGFLDLFATCYARSVAGVVKGLIGEPHGLKSNRLFRNRGGKSFEDVTKAAGLDLVFETMGSNFGDFDNDGYLDMYLATGEPSLATLIPNRMFRNVGGTRFAEITGTSRTGHLQKGHAVAIGDWDRDGDSDLFVETGGAIDGDRYHNVLFQNPGQSKNHWLSLRLVGTKTNRSAIGARIKIVTAGATPQTIHRHVSSGSSFGANPLEQQIGLGKAEKVALVEVRWPTGGTTQVFRDLDADQALEITEGAAGFRTIPRKPLPQPE